MLKEVCNLCGITCEDNIRTFKLIRRIKILSLVKSIVLTVRMFLYMK